MTYDIRELPDWVSASYGWKILSKGLERTRKETIVVCCQVEAETTEEKCDVPQQIATSISPLVAGGLCALSHCIVCGMSRTVMADL